MMSRRACLKTMPAISVFIFDLGLTSEGNESCSSEAVCESIVIRDVKGDCVANFVDFAFLASRWLDAAILSEGRGAR
jgi:hypothetical protein